MSLTAGWKRALIKHLYPGLDNKSNSSRVLNYRSILMNTKTVLITGGTTGSTGSLSASINNMTIPEGTSAEAFNQYVPGRVIAASNGWKNLVVRIYSEPRVEESVIYPAVAEPRIVRILSGAAVVEERELGGSWLKSRVEVGDFFLTASQSPYEVRWRAIGPDPLSTMHLDLR